MASILIIEDETSIQTLFAKALSEEGHLIHVASNGNEGLKILQESKIELIITDILMPSKDGLEIIMHARTLRPRIPVIAISGGGSLAADEYLRTAQAIGAASILQKPVAIEDLLAAVDCSL